MGKNDMKNLMKQAQKMQADLMAAQEELAGLETEATAGGGMVKVKINGELEIKSIEIDPAAVDPDDVEMLQDMVCAAVNEAIRAAQEMGNSRMSSITGGLDFPGF